MKKPVVGKLDLKRVLSIVTYGTVMLCLIAIAATTWFVMSTLQNLSRPPVTGDAPMRIDRIDEPLLDKLLKMQADKTSDVRKLPEPIVNPFATPVPPAPTPPPAPAPTPAP